MRGALERLEAVDLQGIVDAARQHPTDTGHRAEEMLGVERAPESLEHAPAPGGEDLVDGGGDSGADPGQPAERIGAAPRDQLADVL